MRYQSTKSDEFPRTTEKEVFTRASVQMEDRLVIRTVGLGDNSFHHFKSHIEITKNFLEFYQARQRAFSRFENIFDNTGCFIFRLSLDVFHSFTVLIGLLISRIFLHSLAEQSRASVQL